MWPIDIDLRVEDPWVELWGCDEFFLEEEELEVPRRRPALFEDAQLNKLNNCHTKIYYIFYIIAITV